MDNLEKLKKEAHEAECAKEDFKCEYCKDTRRVEVMGDGDNFEWDVVGHKKCNNCQDD